MRLSIVVLLLAAVLPASLPTAEFDTLIANCDQICVENHYYQTSSAPLIAHCRYACHYHYNIDELRHPDGRTVFDDALLNGRLRNCLRGKCGCTDECYAPDICDRIVGVSVSFAACCHHMDRNDPHYAAAATGCYVMHGLAQSCSLRPDRLAMVNGTHVPRNDYRQ